MLLKKSIPLTVFLCLVFTVTQAQMALLSNKTTGEVVPLDSADRVKLVYLSQKVGFQGIYGYVAYGVKGQRYLREDLLAMPIALWLYAIGVVGFHVALKTIQSLCSI